MGSECEFRKAAGNGADDSSKKYKDGQVRVLTAELGMYPLKTSRYLRKSK